jgi:hypothetical protein
VPTATGRDGFRRSQAAAREVGPSSWWRGCRVTSRSGEAS